ncbi:MAG: hypothetical protein LUD69_08405 [Oscillospiraceae bacterium]|nr:hypothetical protein [Oscillospiraceae bacterium]
MRGKAKTIIDGVIFALWALLILAYHAGKWIVEANQLEYRQWVGDWYTLFFWLLPLILLGALLWQFRSGREEGRARKLLTAGFAVYLFVAALVFAAAIFIYALSVKTTESTMSDGNYKITVMTGYHDYTVYYAEPATIFARRTFEWDNNRYAESLSRMYGADFQYIGEDAQGNPQFSAAAYFDIAVTVYGVEDDIEDDLRYMVTSARLEQEWDTYFTSGEELVTYNHDYYSYASYRNPVYAVAVSRSTAAGAAQDLAAFIQNECENAVRADGEPLYEWLDGSVYLLFQGNGGDSEYSGTRNIPYGINGNSWSYDAGVQAEDLLSVFSSYF